MPADKNDPRHSQGGSGGGAGRARGSGRSEHVSGLRDAIAFLNRESIALPDPGTPPWEGRQPADPPPSAAGGPKPPLAPVRELGPAQGRPPAHALPPAPPPVVGNAMQFRSSPGASRRQLPPPPSQSSAPLPPPAPPAPPQLPPPPPPQMDDQTNRSRHELALRFGGGSEYPTGPKPAQGIHAFSAVDWTGIDAIRKQVRERITEQFPPSDAGSEEQRRAFGMAVIEEAVNSWSSRATARGQSVDDARQDAMRRAAGATVFGMGGLAPMLDHPDVETIEYRGCDDGHVVFTDGRVEKAPRIASSDESLLTDVRTWAARRHRVLTPAEPLLDLTVDGGARLTATIGVSKRPTLVVRRHRVVKVTLDDLVVRGMVSPAIAAFLRSAVLAGQTIVVTGPLDAGKTTLLRALAAEIPVMERYATVEAEFELNLDEVGRHPRMVAYQSWPGTAERGPDGRRVGEVTLSDVIEVALRMNVARLVVGEVRGPEAATLLEAVSTGGRAALCAIHAGSAREAFNKFVMLCMRTTMSRDSAVQLAAETLHYVVDIRMDTEPATDMREPRPTGRYVDRVVEINGLGDRLAPVVTEVFAPGPDGRAVFAQRPERLATLQRAGFDPKWFLYGNDQWYVAPVPAAQNVSRPAPHQQQSQHSQSQHQQREGGGGRSFQNMTPVPKPSLTEQDVFDRQYLHERRRLDQE
ncbi:type II secretion system protein E [Catenulispora acidiphila DSM 44928]|uniref:Type II secretion system protein E n=1 Tax=Catenulispora acidiphila (strain DSM 44928 / JCM 14897 / NBRC 102108 / NRRL B-24433 / ID139908) TaxID=479433 RepID=C7Q224_CATAD|nr:ATPase, T2SS/T4P/T4SS family [Catenulispora acidiphila]ACU77561.1 type II secretion system protein E [Catenulispora acidiphila DSM 44928]